MFCTQKESIWELINENDYQDFFDLVNCQKKKHCTILLEQAKNECKDGAFWYNVEQELRCDENDTDESISCGDLNETQFLIIPDSEEVQQPPQAADDNEQSSSSSSSSDSEDSFIEDEKDLVEEAPIKKKRPYKKRKPYIKRGTYKQQLFVGKYPCEHCPRRFKLASALGGHMAKAHQGVSVKFKEQLRKREAYSEIRQLRKEAKKIYRQRFGEYFTNQYRRLNPIMNELLGYQRYN